MAIFELEALDARSGDALVVRFGSRTDYGLLLIDGGFGVTYDEILGPYLADEHNRAQHDPATPLTIDLVVVSHIDRDHIGGIVRLLETIDAQLEGGDDPRLAVKALWHNSFSDSLRALGVPANLPAQAVTSGAVLASVNDGLRVRNLAEKLGLTLNVPFTGLVKCPGVFNVPGFEMLEIIVIGPTEMQLNRLRDEWRDHIQQKLAAREFASVASYLDASIPNLSSIVLYLRQRDRTMLLTGDALGRDTLEGLERAGLCEPGGECHVNILKLPHHGSANSVDSSFFERIVADNYVISGNGSYDNPSVETLTMLVTTQGDRRYEIHLTNDTSVTAFLQADKSSNQRNYEVNVRPSSARSVRIPI